MATLLIYMVGTFHFPFYLFQKIDFEKCNGFIGKRYLYYDNGKLYKIFDYASGHKDDYEEFG
jgi:hypothetical protein